MQKKKAISLIVLVLTITIMLILAGAVILSLNSNNLFQMGSYAVDEYNIDQVQHLAELKWLEAYNDGKRTEEEIRKVIIDAFKQEKIDYSKYAIDVTTEGVVVDGWIQKASTVIRGEQVLQIGDEIAYNAGVEDYTDGWKILGADKDGNLLILSANTVGGTIHLINDNLSNTQNNWLNIKSILDTACEPYGRGIGAVGKARSITVEDVNKGTGIDPVTGIPEGIGSSSYGNKLSYSWEGNNKIKWEGYTSGSKDYAYNSFTWCDNEEKTIKTVLRGDTTTALPTLTDTYYYYKGDAWKVSNAEFTDKAYKMIFKYERTNSSGQVVQDDMAHWIASTSVNLREHYADFGIRAIELLNVKVLGAFNTAGFTGQENLSKGTRAVVTLSSDIKLTGNSTEGWSY